MNEKKSSEDKSHVVVKLNEQIKELTKMLEERERQLSEALKTIKRIINTDPLTGIYNRKAFEKLLKKEISFAKRHNLPLSAAMIDIDHFKNINKKYGHEEGDKILKNFAKTLVKSIRQEDILARYTGDQFALIYPNTQVEFALLACDRIRQKIEKKKFRNINLKITASFGITQLLNEDDSKTIIKRASEALYMAKRKGGNLCKIK